MSVVHKHDGQLWYQSEVTWSPDYHAGDRLIELDSDNSDMWFVEGSHDQIGQPTNKLHSGIRYGVVPAGAVQTAPPLPLVQGTAYNAALRIHALNGGIGILDVFILFREHWWQQKTSHHHFVIFVGGDLPELAE